MPSILDSIFDSCLTVVDLSLLEAKASAFLICDSASVSDSIIVSDSAIINVDYTFG